MRFVRRAVRVDEAARRASRTPCDRRTQDGVRVAPAATLLQSRPDALGGTPSDRDAAFAPPTTSLRVARTTRTRASGYHAVLCAREVMVPSRMRVAALRPSALRRGPTGYQSTRTPFVTFALAGGQKLVAAFRYQAA